MNIRAVLSVLALFAIALPALPQPVPTARPESVGLSSERLALIAPTLEREVETNRMPGAVLAIARNGRLAYYEAFGYLDSERGTPMPRDAIFSIWSMTKPIAIVAALQLFESGDLMVNEPIATYLPELSDRRVAVNGDPETTVAAITQPTIRDLMRHTSGFKYGGGDTKLDALLPAPNPLSVDITGASLLDTLSGLPLAHQPGAVWDYGLSTDLVGLSVERVSGQGLGEYMEENIFVPLGMVDTGFRIAPEDLDRHARPLPYDPVAGVPQPTADHNKVMFECAGGCLASTALDYLAFAQMLLNGGSLDGERILGPKTVEFMTSDHAVTGIDLSRLYGYASLHDDGYGFGLSVSIRRGPGEGGTMGSVGEFHWFGAYGTAFWVDPAEELVIVFMAQTPGEIRRYNRQLIPALVYQAIIE